MPAWLKQKLLIHLMSLDHKRLRMTLDGQIKNDIRWTDYELRKLYLLVYQSDLLNETLTDREVEAHVIERALYYF